MLDGEELGVTELTASESVPEGGPLSRIGITDRTASLIARIFFSILAFLILLLVAYILLKRRQVKKRRRRREERRARLAEEERKEMEFRRNRL
jgi:hypothetical protein